MSAISAAAAGALGPAFSSMEASGVVRPEEPTRTGSGSRMLDVTEEESESELLSSTMTDKPPLQATHGNGTNGSARFYHGGGGHGETTTTANETTDLDEDDDLILSLSLEDDGDYDDDEEEDSITRADEDGLGPARRPKSKSVERLKKHHRAAAQHRSSVSSSRLGSSQAGQQPPPVPLHHRRRRKKKRPPSWVAIAASNGSIPGGSSSVLNGSTLTLTPTPSEARTITSSTVAAIKRRSSGLTRRESGLSRIMSSMTRLFTKNFSRSTDTLFLKSLAGPNSALKREQEDTGAGIPPSFLPVTHDSLRLIDQTKTICEQRIYLDEAKELFSLISSKFLLAVLEIHDEVAAQIENYTEEVEYMDGVSSVDEEDGDEERRLPDVAEEEKKDGEEEEEVKVDTFKFIGVRRLKGECLGLTVRLEGCQIKVSRILVDSIIDRQGLVQCGDIILKANGKDVKNPEELQKVIEESEDITFKIRPVIPDSPETEGTPAKDLMKGRRGMREHGNTLPRPSSKVKKMADALAVHGGKPKYFVRAMFDYLPDEDNLLPCRDIGLTLKHGDILEIVNWDDPSWWQARKVNSKERPGLIPSQDLEERRQCFVQGSGLVTTQASCFSCGTGGRREKRKYDYHVRRNLDFDKAELMLYEPVEKMPPFSRKTLVFISPAGLRKQGIIHRLVDVNPDMFGTTIPLTSRPMGGYEIDGESCWFVSHERMLEGLENNEFLDVGEHDNYLFGTTFESVRNIMAENKLCILDVRPEALKVLHNSTEFLPHVIFLCPPPLETNYNIITAPDLENGKPCQNIELADCRVRRLVEESEQIRREFQKYIDLTFDFDPDSVGATLKEVEAALRKLMSETQWVPRNWVFS